MHFLQYRPILFNDLPGTQLNRFSEIAAFAASVDQDQAAHFVQPDLGSTLSAMLEQNSKNDGSEYANVFASMLP